MNVITPTRIATVLGTVAFLAGALATTATAEPGNPATEAAIAAQRTSVTATDKRSPDTKDAQFSPASRSDRRAPDIRNSRGQAFT